MVALVSFLKQAKYATHIRRALMLFNYASIYLMIVLIILVLDLITRHQ